jgi:hypothetical protein
MADGTLDLSGVSLESDNPVGRFLAVIDEAPEMGEVQGGGKLPEGTPRFTVIWKIKHDVDGDTKYENRKVYQGFNLPDPSYEKHKESMGFVGRFLVGVGYDEKDIKSGKFNLNMDDLVGREAIITVGEKPDNYGEMKPNVKGVRNPNDAGVTSGDLL